MTWHLLNADGLDNARFETGAEIYRQQCADCHGGDGQGNETGYNDPLFGDGKIPEISRVIDQTMPEGEPELCSGDQAEAVAYYIYHEFYSLAARREKGFAPKPRVELSRLTVDQHRHSIADLIAAFTPEPRYESKGLSDYRSRRGNASTQDAPLAEQAGLRGTYFDSRGMNKADSLKVDRVDRRIDFDFGAGSPTADMKPDQFAIIWDGSLFATETGDHDFRIRTENGARLYVNHDAVESRGRLRDDSSVAGSVALIDAWVSSGQRREESARTFLVAGRSYPLRLEFFKYLDDSASITLEWKTPGGVWQVMDHNVLSTAPAKRSFVVDIPFPADDRSLGYERGRSVSNQWHQATNEFAVAAAREVVARLPILAGIESDTPDRFDRMEEFAKQFARRAFRRPVSELEAERIAQTLADNADNLDGGLLCVMLMILKSPSFLYTNLPMDPSSRGYEQASTLAMVMWDSIPDDALLQSAAEDDLKTDQKIRDQANRMLTHSQARSKLTGFFHQWLEIEERDLVKDRDLFPDFDTAMVADLRSSLLRFVDRVVWSKRSDYRELLQSDYLLLNDRLRTLYDPSFDPTLERSPLSDQFRQFKFAKQRRAGVLTHPYLLSAFSYHNSTSPVHRGVFLTRNVVGRALKPPTEAVTFQDDQFDQGLTMREKVTQLTRDSSCMACHSVINPLGFALEGYDAIGRFRTKEGDSPVDTKTQYVTADGDSIAFQNAADIAKFAVDSEDAHRAFVKAVFHHLVKQDPDAYGPDTLDVLTGKFRDNEFNIQKLVVEIAVVAARKT
ncbi:MAG: DUF1592 domain-containing protein [Planctomycetota bacterium]